jgi:hypothetical protein
MMKLPHKSGDGNRSFGSVFRKGAKAQNGSMSDIAIYQQLRLRRLQFPAEVENCGGF